MSNFDHTYGKLKYLFNERYSSNKLSGVDPAVFHRQLQEYMGVDNAAKEGYLEPEKQRDLSVRFHWGHNHDFGGGIVYEGRMAWRHIEILSRFISDYGLPLDLSGKRVLDIGVWTGGTSLLLVALGAEVVALEEVVKYSDTVNYLASAFGVDDRLKCLPKSLYDILPMFSDYFDYIIYSGVIYHVSDPLLSLRLAFSAVRDGGRVFVETAGFDSPDVACRYEGPSVFHSGSAELLNRGGWNYFIPSPKCLGAWCKDAGFQEVQVGSVESDSRLKCVATRIRFEDFCRAGLSRPHTR